MQKGFRYQTQMEITVDSSFKIMSSCRMANLHFLFGLYPLQSTVHADGAYTNLLYMYIYPVIGARTCTSAKETIHGAC